MKNNLILDVKNLLCKKEVILSKDEILQVALFAIQNGIVKIDSENICGVNEINSIELLNNGILKIDNQYEQHTILVKPYYYKEES